MSLQRQMSLLPPRPPSRAASHTSRVSVVSRGAKSLYDVGSVHSIRSTVARSHAGFAPPQEQWRPPVLSSALCTTIPRASHYATVYSILQAVFTIITGVFDVYTLAEAEPGKDHFGYYILSFDFVYAGNPNVRWCLLVLGVVSAVLGVMLLIVSILLLKALQQEHEPWMRPWLLVMFLHTFWRLLAFIFAAFVNDMYFTYHGLMCALWTLMVPLNVYGWLVVWSMFNELAEVSRLEDIANLKMGTLTSLSTNHWRSPSISVPGGYSRPTTPHGFRNYHRPSVTSDRRHSIYSDLDQRRHSIYSDLDQRRPSVYSDPDQRRPSVSINTDQRRPSVSINTDQPLPAVSIYTDQPRPSVSSAYQDELC